EGVWLNVGEYRRRPDISNGEGSRHVCVRLGNDFVTWPDAERPEPKGQGCCPAADPDRESVTAIAGEFPLELRELLPKREPRSRQDFFKGHPQFISYRSVVTHYV